MRDNLRKDMVEGVSGLRAMRTLDRATELAEDCCEVGEGSWMARGKVLPRHFSGARSRGVGRQRGRRNGAASVFQMFSGTYGSKRVQKQSSHGKRGKKIVIQSWYGKISHLCKTFKNQYRPSMCPSECPASKVDRRKEKEKSSHKYHRKLSSSVALRIVHTLHHSIPYSSTIAVPSMNLALLTNPLFEVAVAAPPPSAVGLDAFPLAPMQLSMQFGLFT